MTVQVANAFLDGPDLRIFEREGSAVRERRVKPEYSFFVESKDLDAEFARSLRSSRSVRAMLEEGRYTRIVWADEWVRKAMVYGRKEGDRRIPSPFMERGIKVFEGDVDPLRRWFTDTAAAAIATPTNGWFDLETDSRVTIANARKGQARILSIALSNDDESETWLGILAADTDDAERALLREFFRRIDQHGFTRMIAWNGAGFDFDVLKARIDRLGLDIDVRKYLWLDHLILFRRMNLNSSDSGEEKQSMALNAIAFAQLGEGKEEVPPEVAARWPGKKLAELAWQLWEAGGEFRELLGRYNLKDTILMPRIEKKTGFVALFDTLADVCRVIPDTRGLLPTQQMDGFMLRLGVERGYRFPTREWRDGEEQPDQFKGAFVMHPKVVPSDSKEWNPDDAARWRARMGLGHGILSNVHVADFASLYPSIIITWNMSPETRRDVPIDGPIPEGHCRSPLTGVGFTTEFEGILPAALKVMIAMRKKWSDLAATLPPGTPEAKEAQRRSMAYKVAANSFYGVVGSPYSRYFDRRVAESVTQNGVWLIKRTIHEAEAAGWKPGAAAMEVMYGDTDSFFAMKTTQAEFDEFVRWCNAVLYPKILAEVGCRLEWSAVKLAYEKAFDVLVMAAKKRYAGRFAHYKGTPGKPVPGEGEAFDKARHSKPEIKGFEFKRGDASVLARRLQERVIMTLMRGVTAPMTYRALISEALAHVQSGDLPLTEIQITKSLTKPLKEYRRKSPTGADVALPPHVRIAEQMLAAGREIGEGARVSYVVVDGSDGIVAISSEDYAGELDRYYLWDNTVYPPTMRLLQAAFPDEDWTTGLERTRPPRPRRTGKKAVEEQVDLFAEQARHALVASALNEVIREVREIADEDEARAASLCRTIEWEAAWRGRG